MTTPVLPSATLNHIECLTERKSLEDIRSAIARFDEDFAYSSTSMSIVENEFQNAKTFVPQSPIIIFTDIRGGLN